MTLTVSAMDKKDFNVYFNAKKVKYLRKCRNLEHPSTWTPDQKKQLMPELTGDQFDQVLYFLQKNDAQYTENASHRKELENAKRKAFDNWRARTQDMLSADLDKR